MKIILYAPFILAASLGAQTAPSVPNKPPIQQVPPRNAPALTELEATKLELYGAQNVLLRNQEQELKAKFNALIQAINTNHPGYMFNMQNGTLMPIPTPPKAEETKPFAPPEVKK